MGPLTATLLLLPTLVGWASETGGTTGGGNATPIVVTDAISFSVATPGDQPRVIHVKSPLFTNEQLVGSNKTSSGSVGPHYAVLSEFKDNRTSFLETFHSGSGLVLSAGSSSPSLISRLLRSGSGLLLSEVDFFIETWLVLSVARPLRG